MRYNVYWINLLLIFFLATAFQTTPAKRKTLFGTIPQNDITKYLAFYELFPNTPEGRLALDRALGLLAGGRLVDIQRLQQGLAHSREAIQGIISLVNKPQAASPKLSQDQLASIEALGDRLANRKLKGHHVKSQEEVLLLAPEEIDLARGVFLSHVHEGEMDLGELRAYEATLDLMALQIAAKLPASPSPEEIVRAISHFIFFDMNFRFPPHSLFVKEIDQYTFLPSVLDSRRGVCLGVSILYTCIAQRLGLSLELITPPGHIYVRYRKGGEIRNIETTARGVHIDTEEYMGVEYTSLAERNTKEAIGMVHFNHASIHWQNRQFERAIREYERAYLYIGDDPTLLHLMGYVSLLNGDEERGCSLLQRGIQAQIERGEQPELLSEEYLAGKCDKETILACFCHVDETYQSLLEKKAEIQKSLDKYPDSCGARFAMAGVLMQQNRLSEALTHLQHFHKINQDHITIEYYLAALYAERRDFNRTWEHLKNAEALAESRGKPIPRPLRHLRRELKAVAPN